MLVLAQGETVIPTDKPPAGAATLGLIVSLGLLAIALMDTIAQIVQGVRR